MINTNTKISSHNNIRNPQNFQQSLPVNMKYFGNDTNKVDTKKKDGLGHGTNNVDTKKKMDHFMVRRKFDLPYKLSAIKLITEASYSVKEVSKELDTHTNSL